MYKVGSFFDLSSFYYFSLHFILNLKTVKTKIYNMAKQLYEIINFDKNLTQ